MNLPIGFEANKAHGAAIVAFAVSYLSAWLRSRYGVALPTEVESGIVAIVLWLVVYWTRNKTTTA